MGSTPKGPTPEQESRNATWRARVARVARRLDLDVRAAAPGAPVQIRLETLEAFADRVDPHGRGVPR